MSQNNGVSGEPTGPTDSGSSETSGGGQGSGGSIGSSGRPLNRSEIDRLLTEIHREKYDYILRYIKKITYGYLSPDQEVDVYQQSMLEVTAKLAATRRLEVPPIMMVFVAAKSRGCDALRRRSRRRRELQIAESDDEEGSPLEAMAVQPVLPDSLELEELREALDFAIEQLPRKQKLVAKMVLRVCGSQGEGGIFSRVSQLVSKVTGATENEGSVKRCWQVARKKLMESLPEVEAGVAFLFGRTLSDEREQGQIGSSKGGTGSCWSFSPGQRV